MIFKFVINNFHHNLTYLLGEMGKQNGKKYF